MPQEKSSRQLSLAFHEATGKDLYFGEILLTSPQDSTGIMTQTNALGVLQPPPHE